MKPFNLEEAKAGKKVVTRDGKSVRIASFGTNNNSFPVSAAVDIGICDAINEYTINGSYLRSGNEHHLDLLMADDEPKQEGSVLQKWSKEILPIVQAAANDEEFEIKELSNQWKTKTNATFTADLEYRIKPNVKMVNGFEVPMHETVAPAVNATYYTPDIHDKSCNTAQWLGDSCDLKFLASGIVYLDKESATKCAKAMLGINPEDEA